MTKNDELIRRESFITLHTQVTSFVDDLEAKLYSIDQIMPGIEVITIRNGWPFEEFMSELKARNLTLHTEIESKKKNAN